MKNIKTFEEFDWKFGFGKTDYRDVRYSGGEDWDPFGEEVIVNSNRNPEIPLVDPIEAKFITDVFPQNRIVIAREDDSNVHYGDKIVLSQGRKMDRYILSFKNNKVIRDSFVEIMKKKYPEKEIYTFDGFDEYYGRADHDAIIMK